MPDALFDDLPILEELGASLRAAMAAEEASAAASAPQAAARRRRPRFGWLGSFLVLGLVGTAAAAGTLTVLRGSPIPGPSARDAQPSMTPKRDSLRVLELRAPDPAGSVAAGGATPQLPFALRVGESEAGQLCASVGQLDGEDFGIVGADGRFRAMDAGIVDGCGVSAPGAPAVAGIRVFDARSWRDARTVIYGAGATNLNTATLTVRGVRRPLEVRDGAYLGAVLGYPEDSDLHLRLEYADGTRTFRALGQTERTILDPAGPAWRVDSFGSTISRHASKYCVTLRAQRVGLHPSDRLTNPELCARAGRITGPGSIAPDYMVEARTYSAAEVAAITGRDDAASRTLAWGWVRRSRITRVTVAGGADAVRVRRELNGEFARVMLPVASAAPLRVVLTTRTGQRIVLRGEGRWRGRTR